MNVSYVTAELGDWQLQYFLLLFVQQQQDPTQVSVIYPSHLLPKLVLSFLFSALSCQEWHAHLLVFQTSVCCRVECQPESRLSAVTWLCLSRLLANISPDTT